MAPCESEFDTPVLKEAEPEMKQGTSWNHKDDLQQAQVLWLFPSFLIVEYPHSLHFTGLSNRGRRLTERLLYSIVREVFHCFD